VAKIIPRVVVIDMSFESGEDSRVKITGEDHAEPFFGSGAFSRFGRVMIFKNKEVGGGGGIREGSRTTSRDHVICTGPQARLVSSFRLLCSSMSCKQTIHSPC
jgi:hypothetical protein